MHILVTGVTGFIGHAVSGHLSEAGHTVSGLSRDAEAARRAVPWLTSSFSWTPLTEDLPAEALDGVDAVVHLLGEGIAGRWTAGKKQAISESRIESTRRLVAAMARRETRPSVLISASAMGWYGERGDEELVEAEPAGAGFLANVCQRWEAEAVAAEDLGVRVVRLRSGNVMGQGGGFLGPMLPLFRWGLGGPLGSGRQWWPWIHLADHARLISHLLTEPISGPVNASAPEAVRQRDFAKALGHVLHRPAVLPIPAFALNLLLGEFAHEALVSQRMVPQRALESGFQFEFASLELALRDCAWRHEGMIEQGTY